MLKEQTDYFHRKSIRIDNLKALMQIKGYNESSCPPLFREIEDNYTEVKYREKDKEKPGHEL